MSAGPRPDSTEIPPLKDPNWLKDSADQTTVCEVYSRQSINIRWPSFECPQSASSCR